MAGLQAAVFGRSCRRGLFKEKNPSRVLLTPGLFNKNAVQGGLYCVLVSLRA